MTMRTDIYYGYGIKTSNIKIRDVESLKGTMRSIHHYEELINEYFQAKNIKEPTVKDYLDYMEDENGLAGLLETAIYEETGISLYSCCDDNGEFYLMYPETYPWHLVRREICLTEEKLKQLFQKYVGWLTDEPIEVDYQRCVRCG